METFLTIEHEDFGDVVLIEARWLTEEEKQHKNPEYREILMVGVGTHVRLPHVKIFDLPDRKPDGCFMGCSNSSWVISREEWDTYLSLESSRKKEEEERKRAERISWLTEKIERMEKQKKLYTDEEAARLRKEWNDTYNEGGEGYVPHFYTQAEYDLAVEELGRLKG